MDSLCVTRPGVSGRINAHGPALRTDNRTVDDAAPNRRTINATGESRFNAARRSAGNFAVAVIDIDHFKSINDRFGNECGDRAFKHVATLLAQNCRGPSLVGRLGGEEFVALLEDASTSEAIAAAERLRSAIEQSPFVINGDALQMTVSVGVSQIAAEDREFDDVLRAADKALYAAKSGGRNRVEAAAAASPARPTAGLSV